MQGYPTIIRTGDPQLDLQTVEQHRRSAAAQGLALHVLPLPGGGYQLALAGPLTPAPPDPVGATLPSNPVGATLPSNRSSDVMAAARPASQPTPMVPAMPAMGDPGGTLPSRQSGFAVRQAAPQVQVILGPGEGYCEACHRVGPLKRVTLMQNVGALVLRFPRTISGQLCKFCIDKYFFRFTAITLIGGWWGILSFFYSLVAIPSNVVNWLGSLGMKTPQEDIESLRDRRSRGTALIAIGTLDAAFALLCIALGALMAASGDTNVFLAMAVVGGVAGLVASILLFFGIRTRARASGGLRRLGAT
jgi:hypothetical protein